MHICILSRFWPEDERSGVTLAAAKHVKILIMNGYDVSIIGSGKGVLCETLVQNKYQVPASGSGAIYSPARLNKAQLEKTLKKISPDLLIIEAWQTAITDGAIEVANQMNLPILMVSHGISLFPHNFSFTQLIRSAGWQFYRLFKLPRLIKKLSALTALDLHAKSYRFYDRDLALSLNKLVMPLKNCSSHPIPFFIPWGGRKRQVIVIGYYSAIKNQLGAIQTLLEVRSEASFLFIGKKEGQYYQACLKMVKKKQLEDRFIFRDDEETDLVQELAESAIVFAPSLTEALPTTLIEAMACGTPFVATPVGANTSFEGGVLAEHSSQQSEVIDSLLSNRVLWENYSSLGRAQYAREFSKEKIEAQLLEAIKLALKNKSCQIR